MNTLKQNRFTTLLGTILVLLLTTTITEAQADLFTWSFQTGGDVQSSVTISEDMVYVGSYDSNFYALDTLGNMKWQFNSHYSIKSTALAVDSIVCFQSGNRLYGLNKHTGDMLWIHEPVEVKSKNPIIAFDQWDMKDSSPILNDSVVYYGNEYGILYGVDITSGTEMFKYNTERQNAIRTTATILNDTIYFGDWDGYVYAVNITDATLAWEIKTYSGDKPYSQFGPIIGDMVLYEELLYFGIRNGEFQVLDRRNGDKVWSVGDPNATWYSGIPYINDDTLYLGTSDSHTLHAFNAKTGNELWNVPIDRGIYNSVIMYNDYLVIAAGDESQPQKETGSGRLYILDKSGSVVNAVSLPGDVFNTPAIHNDLLVFGSRDNNLHSISMSSLILNPEENIEYDNTTLDLGLIEVNKSVNFDINTIYNKGLKVYSFQLAHESTSLPETSISVSPSEGTLLAKDSVPVRLTIKSDQLENGSYSLTLKLIDAQNPMNIIEKEIAFTKDYVSSINIKKEVRKEIGLYPNPFRDEVYLISPIETKNNLVVKIYNLQGKELRSVLLERGSESELIRLDFSSLPNSGMYLYAIFSDDVFYTSGKLVRE